MVLAAADPTEPAGAGELTNPADTLGEALVVGFVGDHTELTAGLGVLSGLAAVGGLTLLGTSIARRRS